MTRAKKKAQVIELVPLRLERAFSNAGLVGLLCFTARSVLAAATGAKPLDPDEAISEVRVAEQALRTDQHAYALRVMSLHAQLAAVRTRSKTKRLILDVLAGAATHAGLMCASGEIHAKDTEGVRTLRMAMRGILKIGLDVRREVEAQPARKKKAKKRSSAIKPSRRKAPAKKKASARKKGKRP